MKTRLRGYVRNSPDGWQVWLYIPSIGGYKCRVTLYRTRADARLALKAWREAN